MGARKSRWARILKLAKRAYLNPTVWRWWVVVDSYEVWTFSSLEELRRETGARLGAQGQKWMDEFGWCEWVELLPKAVR